MDNEHRGLGSIHDLLVAAGARGEENRYPSSDLAKASGAEDVRTLQEMIRAERDPRDPIIGSNLGGYFLPSHGPQGRGELIERRNEVAARGVNTLALARLYDQAIALRDQAESGQGNMFDCRDVAAEV